MLVDFSCHRRMHEHTYVFATGAPTGDIYFFFEQFLAAPTDVVSSINSTDHKATQEMLCKIHDGALVVAGEVEVETPP